MRQHAHLRHDRRDTILLGMFLVGAPTVIGLVVVPEFVAFLVDMFGPYRATLIGSVVLAVAMVATLRWINR